MKSLLRKASRPVLTAFVVVLAVAASAGASSKQPATHHKAAVSSAVGNPSFSHMVLGVHNGVITACWETRGNKQTKGDLKFFGCQPGFKKLSWNIKGQKGDTGAAGKDAQLNVTPLAAGDSHCANGGAALSNGTTTQYVCNGTNGRDGTNGTNGGGTPGTNGTNGTNGKDAPVLDAGEGRVDITRGQSTSTWGDYPTVLDPLIGGSTGQPFRFTCTTAQAPCTVAAKAAVISDKAGTESVYVRLSLSRDGSQETAPQPRYYCEYADGPAMTLTKQPRTATPSFTAVPLDIGGTADCYNEPQAGGVVTAVSVPAGFYNVEPGFLFKPVTPSS